MELPEDTIADVTRRLRRIEGQVRGLQQMLADGRDCREFVPQLSAANKALEQAGFVILAAGLTWCLEDPERSAAEGYELADVQKMFTKLAPATPSSPTALSASTRASPPCCRATSSSAPRTATRWSKHSTRR